MKQTILTGILFLLIISFASSQSQPLSSTQFIQQNKGTEKTDPYQCIQIRRDDKITLTGEISFINENRETDSQTLSFTSLGGRTFLLKGDLIPEIIEFVRTLKETENVIIKGTVLFEGLENIPAELEVTKYKPSEE